MSVDSWFSQKNSIYHKDTISWVERTGFWIIKKTFLFFKKNKGNKLAFPIKVLISFLVCSTNVNLGSYSQESKNPVLSTNRNRKARKSTPWIHCLNLKKNTFHIIDLLNTIPSLQLPRTTLINLQSINNLIQINTSFSLHVIDVKQCSRIWILDHKSIRNNQIKKSKIRFRKFQMFQNINNFPPPKQI